MKNIFTTIEYVAEKITEAITGHKNDEQAHPNLSEQINVLSTGVSNIENTRKLKTYLGLQDIGMTTESTFLEIAQAMPNNSTILFSSYAPLNWFPQSVTGDRNDIEITRYGGGISYIKVWLSNVKTGVWHGYYTEQTGLVWQQLATTTKTDILQSDLLNGWTIPLSSYDSSITKMGNQVFVKLMVKNEAPNPDTILVLPYPAIKATHLFVTTQNRKSIQCRVVNNTIIISNYQGLEANEWVNINGSYTTNS